MAKPLLIFLIVILAACSSAPRFYSGSGVLPEVKQSASQRYADAADSTQVLATEEGVASFYAEDFNGKPTYSGVIYNMHGLSAAHPTYPMGTIIRVTNLSNMKTVILEVNDRMPQHPDRIIDLSLGAADALGMREDGLQKVKIEVLKWGTGRK
jgi:rare lipoprotein A